jgi:hypothetical protein
MECRLAGETEVLGENLPQRHKNIYIYINVTVSYLLFILSSVCPDVTILEQVSRFSPNFCKTAFHQTWSTLKDFT